jgi:hypothetical protein
MRRLLVCIVTVLLGWTSTIYAAPQADKTRSGASRDSILTDRTLGISFLSIGQAAGQDANGYRMCLQSSVGTIRLATAAVSVSSERVVDLSGSYGGKLYLDEPKAMSLLKNRVKVDTLNIDGLRFRREFWAVYAGMGAWEGVINCYAFHNGQYYVLSLNAEIMLGKPGEVVEGGRMTAELLRTRVVEILNDSQEPVIQRFNDLLSSFQVRT